MMKRFLSMILALMMVLSMLPAQALATELPEVEAEEIVLETQVPETEPATEPVPATEPAPAETVPATEPAAATEPAPTEVVAEQVTNEANNDIAISVSITFFSWDGSETEIEVTMGEEFSMPQPSVDSPGEEFRGWELLRHGINDENGRGWLTDEYEFVNDDDTERACFEVGYTFNTNDEWFDFENYDYAFYQKWETKPYISFSYWPDENNVVTDGAQITVGDMITVSDHGLEGVTDTFEGWMLLRCGDGAWYSEDGNFTTDEAVDSVIFKPNDSIEVSESLFETDEEYYFYGIWKNHVLFTQTGLPSMRLEYGETVTFPTDVEFTPGCEGGWYLRRSDNTELSEDGNFEMYTTLRFFRPGETLEITESLFDNTKYIYTFGMMEKELPDPNKFYFGFEPIGNDDNTFGERAIIGETFEIPESNVENGGRTFKGWFLTREDGARYTAAGTFTTDESVDAKVFAPGDSLLIEEGVFEPESHGYSFSGIWDGAVIVEFLGTSKTQTFAYGDEITLPEGEEMDGWVFEGWYLSRRHGGALREDGNFAKGWEAESPTVYFQPGETIEITAEWFDNYNYTYELGGTWSEYRDPDAVYFGFKPDSAAENNVYGSYKDVVVIPDHGIENPEFEFVGWKLLQSDYMWYAADGSFTADETKAAKIFTPGETFAFDAEQLNNQDDYYTFYGIWEDAVTFEFWDAHGPQTIAVGSSITLPDCSNLDEGDVFTGWVLGRSDNAVLMTDGAFDWDGGEVKLYQPGDTLTVTASLFDTTKFIYYFYPDIVSTDVFLRFDLPGGYENDREYVRKQGETFTIPNIPVNNPGFEMEGWFLINEEGEWYTEDGIFTMDPSKEAKTFSAGDTLDVDEALFEAENYGYSFYPVWKNAVTLVNNNACVDQTVKIGQTITIPEAGESVMEGYEFCCWCLYRSDYARFMEDGTFSHDEDAVVAKFYPGDELTIDSESFDGTKYVYLLDSIYFEIQDPTKVGLYFYPLGADMGKYFSQSLGETFVIPECEMSNPGFEFEGWFLTKRVFHEDDSYTVERYSTGNTFTSAKSAASKIFKPGDTLNLDESKFISDENITYQFYGIWKNAVSFTIAENDNNVTYSYGDDLLFPENTAEAMDGYVFDSWFLWRNDGYVLATDGNYYYDMENTQFFKPGDTIEISKDFFDNTKYVYYITGMYTEIERPMTEELLREQLADGFEYIEINADITLEDDLVIPESVTVYICPDITFTVPAGVTLDVQGYLTNYRGTVKIESGATLRSNVSTYTIYIGSEGILDATGANVSDVIDGAISVETGAVVSGIPTEKICRYYLVEKTAQIKEAIALADDYYLINANCIKNFTINENLTLPNNMALVIQQYNLKDTTTVTVAAGKTLTVEGDIEIYNQSKLVVPKGATLICNGGTYLFANAALTNNGTVRARLHSIVPMSENCVVGGSGNYICFYELYEIESTNEIQACYADGASDISVFYSDIEIAEDLELPDDLKLTFVDCEITVGEGVTVSGGELELWESTLYLDGMYEGGEVLMDNASRVVPEEKIVSSREEDYLFYVKLGWPKATGIAVKNSDGDTVSGTTVTVDMKETPTYQLKSITEPALASDEASWKTSSATIATVDENGLVTFKKPGAVTITATAKDGSGKSASVQFNVSYLDPATKLTVTADVPEIGLQTGYMAEMIVSGTDVIDPANLIYSSSDNEIATVEEGVIIAGEKLGTATITAAIAGDPLDRKISLKVKVIALQTEELNLALEGVDSFEEVTMLDENGNVTNDPAAVAELLLDKEDVTTENNTFHIDYEAIGYNFAPVLFALNEMDSGVKLDPGVEWVSSDTRIATVTPDETGALVTLKADGVVTITAVTNDLSKVEKSLTVAVRDYTPRLGATSLTMNSYLKSGVDVALLESYGKKIEDVALYEYDTVAKDYAEETSDRLMPDYNDGVLNITPANGVELKNGTIKLLLKVTVEGGKPYEYKITLKVANTLPAITIKQASKVNLFYTDSVAVLNVAAKDAVITGVTMENTDAFTLITDGETGEMLICNENVEGKPDTSATLVVELEGYRVPATKNFTISTVTTKPSLVLTATSSTISTYRPDSDPTTSFSIKNKSTGEILYLWDATVETLATDIATCEIQEDLETIQLTLRENKGGTSAIYVQYPNWADSIKLTHKITVKSTLPTPSLSASTVKLNNILTDITAQTTVKLNQSNWEIVDVVLTPTGKAAAIEEASKIKNGLTFDKNTATINFYLDSKNPDSENPESENLPKAGTYSFDYVVYVRDGEKVIPLPKKTLKVTVSATVPTVKLQSATVKLNKTIGNDSMAMTTVTLANAGEYWLYDLLPVVPEGAEYPFELYFNYDYGIDGMIFVNMKDDVDVEKLPDSKYTVELTPVLMGDVEAVQLKKTVKLTVQIFSGKPSITVTAKGKLDTINPDSEIVYTISKRTNLPGEPYDVELLGEDAELFDYSPVMIGAKYGISLTKKDGAVLATNKNYKLQFNISTVWLDENDEYRTYTVPVDISFKPTQSSLKFAKIPTLNLYQSSDLPLRCNVALTAPVGAVLDESSITLGSKTAAQFIRAVGDGELIYDPQSGELSIDIENPGALIYGKSYTVYLDVTPVGNASNVKPTQLKLTVKVFK